MGSGLTVAPGPGTSAVFAFTDATGGVRLGVAVF
jgi:hypothetical protein